MFYLETSTLEVYSRNLRLFHMVVGKLTWYKVRQYRLTREHHINNLGPCAKGMGSQ